MKETIERQVEALWQAYKQGQDTSTMPKPDLGEFRETHQDDLGLAAIDTLIRCAGLDVWYDVRTRTTYTADVDKLWVDVAGYVSDRDRRNMGSVARIFAEHIAEAHRRNSSGIWLDGLAWDGDDHFGEFCRLASIDDYDSKMYVRKWLWQCVALLHNTTTPLKPHPAGRTYYQPAGVLVSDGNYVDIVYALAADDMPISMSQIDTQWRRHMDESRGGDDWPVVHGDCRQIRYGYDPTQLWGQMAAEWRLCRLGYRCQVDKMDALLMMMALGNDCNADPYFGGAAPATPTNTTTEPTDTSTEPTDTSTEPTGTSTEPAEPTDTSTEPAEPTDTSTEPTTEPTDTSTAAPATPAEPTKAPAGTKKPSSQLVRAASVKSSPGVNRPPEPVQQAAVPPCAPAFQVSPWVPPAVPVVGGEYGVLEKCVVGTLKVLPRTPAPERPMQIMNDGRQHHAGVQAAQCGTQGCWHGRAPDAIGIADNLLVSQPVQPPGVHQT